MQSGLWIYDDKTDKNKNRTNAAFWSHNFMELTQNCAKSIQP